MINPTLIERTEVNLQKLAEKMPEKFIHDGNRFMWVERPEMILVMIQWYGSKNRIYIGDDPRQQFSNSIGRIIKVAFDKDIPPMTYLEVQLEYLNRLIEQSFA